MNRRLQARQKKGNNHEPIDGNEQKAERSSPAHPLEPVKERRGMRGINKRFNRGFSNILHFSSRHYRLTAGRRAGTSRLPALQTS